MMERTTIDRKKGEAADLFVRARCRDEEFERESGQDARESLSYVATSTATFS